MGGGEGLINGNIGGKCKYFEKNIPQGIMISLISGKNLSETPKFSIYATIVILSPSLAILGWKVPVHNHLCKKLNSDGFKLS